MSHIGEKVKSIRLARKQTQKEFGLDMAVEQSSLSQIENGTLMPSITFIRRFVKKYGLTYEWVLDDETPAAFLQAIAFDSALTQLLAKQIKTILREEKQDLAVFSVVTTIPLPRLKDIFNSKSEMTVAEVILVLAAYPHYNANWFLMDKGEIKVDLDRASIENLMRQYRETMEFMKQIAENSSNLAIKK